MAHCLMHRLMNDITVVLLILSSNRSSTAKLVVRNVELVLSANLLIGANAESSNAVSVHIFS